jgi:hypothetical protein
MIGACLGLLASVWLNDRLLRWLDERHRPFFISELGAPTSEQLRGNAYTGARRQLQGRFLRFRWSGEFLKLRDPHLNALNFGLMAAEVVVILCVLIAFFEMRLK